jgi:lipopolysaccharide export LptBFGC system permease protein LptF
MKILTRYILAAYLRNYIISLMVLIGLYVVLDMVFNFDEFSVSRDDVHASAMVLNILQYYFFQSFRIFAQLSGVIPVVAAAFTFLRLSRFNELTAMMAAGMHLVAVARPAIIAAVVVSLGLPLINQEIIIPSIIPQLTRARSEDADAQQRLNAIQNMRDVMPGQDDKTFGLLFAADYKAPTESSPAVMEKIDRLQIDDQFNLTAHLTADRATYDPDMLASTLVVSNRWAQQAKQSVQTFATNLYSAKTADAGDSTLIELCGTKAQLDSAVQSLASYGAKEISRGGSWKLDNGQLTTDVSSRKRHTEPALYYNSNVTPEEISLYRSGDYVELLSTSRINELLQRTQVYGANDLLRVKHARLAQLLINIFMVLLAISCVLIREQGQLRLAIIRCLILVGSCMATIFICQNLASNPPSANWDDSWPALMAWMPIFIFGPLSVFMLDRVKT